MTVDEKRIMADHFEYLTSLLEDGALIMAGPSLDGAFGLAIYEAEDEEAARTIMTSNPSVANGVMSATLHPYRISLLRGRE